MSDLSWDAAYALSLAPDEKSGRLEGWFVLDNRLPKESGIELVRRLRERAVKSKVILMTAYETPEVKAEAKRLKVDRYVRKPFDLTVFVEEVRNLIGPAGNATAG